MKISYNKIRYLLAALLFAALVVIVLFKWAFRPSQSSVQDKKADISIGSAEIINHFYTNEDSANTLYLNKVILVSGVVESVSEKEQETTVYLKSANDPVGILCSFNKASFDIKPVKVGEIVTIKGVCTGYLMDVVLNKCSIEE